MNLQKKWKIVDIIYIIILVAVVICVAIYHIHSCVVAQTPVEINGLITNVLIAFLSLVGLVDIFNMFGWEVIVPSFIVNRGKALAEKAIQEYVKCEIDTISTQQEDHIAFFLRQVGLSQKSYTKLHYELIRLKLHKIIDLPDAKSKLTGIIGLDSVVVDQNASILPENRKYYDVDYYLDLSNVMFEHRISDFLVQSLAKLIQETEKDLNQIEWIVMPEGGNYLLCHRVSEMLNKRFLQVFPEGPIDKTKKWLGVNFNPERCIIVNDVLVSGNRIRKAADALAEFQDSFHAYFLVGRKEHDQERKKQLGDNIVTHCLLEINDREIAQHVSRSKTA